MVEDNQHQGPLVFEQAGSSTNINDQNVFALPLFPQPLPQTSASNTLSMSNESLGLQTISTHPNLTQAPTSNQENNSDQQDTTQLPPAETMLLEGFKAQISSTRNGFQEQIDIAKSGFQEQVTTSQIGFNGVYEAVQDLITKTGEVSDSVQKVADGVSSNNGHMHDVLRSTREVASSTEKVAGLTDKTYDRMGTLVTATMGLREDFQDVRTEFQGLRVDVQGLQTGMKEMCNAVNKSAETMTNVASLLASLVDRLGQTIPANDQPQDSANDTSPAITSTSSPLPGDGPRGVKRARLSNEPEPTMFEIQVRILQSTSVLWETTAETPILIETANCEQLKQFCAKIELAYSARVGPTIMQQNIRKYKFEITGFAIMVGTAGEPEELQKVSAQAYTRWYTNTYVNKEGSQLTRIRTTFVAEGRADLEGDFGSADDEGHLFFCNFFS